MGGTVREELARSAPDAEERRMRVAASGAVLGAILSSSCCIIPLALFLLGIGGSWIGTLASLAPYQPFFMVPTVAILASGFRHVYGRRRACADGEVCARRLPGRMVEAALWSATVLVIAAFTFNWWGPWVLGIR
jgi:mercuric ion transport protein